MILTLMPVSASAAAEENGTAQTTRHILSTIKHEVDGDGKETGQITAQIEAYLTDSANQTRTVKPCDIIFLIEQSAFMNTQSNTTSYGQERANILNTMEKMLDAIPAPTTGGEHRVAISGYGRINNPGNSDTYVPNQYPGVKLDSSKNQSLNTGYYTCEGGDPVFHSANGWTEWSQVEGNDDKTLPRMPNGYLEDVTYDNVFMPVSDAKKVIDADKMVSWHAQASRMDAGLQLTEKLAQIAAAHKASRKDRNLIVFIAASSLPYQNQDGGYQTLRPEAAMEAANTLKTSYGATIFGFGDFNKLNLNNGLTEEEQRDNFNATMASICGRAGATDGASYFKGLSQAHDIDAALSELLIQIDANVNPSAEKLPIDVDSFQEAGSEHTSHTWAQIKAQHHILSSSSINEIASVDYYRFTGYDKDNTPQFDSEPARHTYLNISQIGKGESIQTTLNLAPIPPANEEGSAYGEKAVITITDPVCVNYQWVGDWEPPFDPPKHEHAVRNTTISPANPEQQEASKENVKLKFDGWYRLWNDDVDQGGAGKKTWNYKGKTYVPYQNTIYDAFGSDLQLYGRWVPYIDVNFHWAAGSVSPEGLAPPSSVSLPLDDAGGCSYQAETPTLDGYEFGGWYKDSNCTQPYNSKGEKLSANTDLYGRWTKLGTKKVTFTVVNGSWNTGSTWYKQQATSTDDENSVTVQVPLRNGKGTLTTDLIPYVDHDDMKPSVEYKAPGTWGNSAPDTNVDAITENGTYHYTYTFPEKDTYTITYRWVPGTEVPENVSLPAQQSVKESVSGAKPTIPIQQTIEFSDKKWTFDGWYTKSETTKTYQPFSDTTYSFDNTTEKNLTLYGKWSHTPCTVTFYADYYQPVRGYFNGDLSSVSYPVPYGSTLAKLAEEVPAPAPNSTARYYFQGWMDNYGDSNSDTFYTSSEIQTMTVKRDWNFVAQWWPIVTFDANGGVWELSKDHPDIRYVPVPANTNNHIDALRPPVKEGYTFLGWYDDKDAGKLIDFDTETFDGAKTVYAHWAKNATVTFKIVNGYWSGGTAEDKNVTVVLYPQADGSVGGTLPASSVPAIMIPAAGYENAAGSWDAVPNIEPNGIVDSVTYTYTFGQTHSGGSTSTKLTLHYESNGGTSYRDERYSSGTTVTLDKAPVRESYTFTGWYADKALTDKITNVKMTGNKTVYAGWTATNVPDMLNGDDHYAYVVGYSDGTVRPNANISRAEVATIFFRLLKEEVRDGNLTTENTFADVTDGQWHNKAISTMAKLGAVKGRNAEAFDPDAPITRAEFATICARFDKTQISTSSNFTDISGHWAEKYIERAATLGWIAGYSDGTFRPSNYITRAEAMTMINRVLCRVPETESNLLPGMITWPDNQPGTWYYLAVQEATNSHDYDRKDAIHEKWTALTEAPDWKYDLAQ